MMSLRRIFGLMLLFLFFETIVVVVTTRFFPDVNILYACLAMTGLAIVTWLVFYLIIRFVFQRASKPAEQPKAFVPAVQKTSPSDDSFTLEFTSLITEANRRLQALASADGKGTALNVFTLPLYFVLGSEGSGKTTAIVNSGLEPRLLAGQTQHEGTIIPTSTANIWYIDGTIFIELSGRCLQEAARLEKILELLAPQKKLPRWKRFFYGEQIARLNLRGVILVNEIDTFIRTRDVTRLSSISRTLNERLQTLQSSVRTDFPVYMLFTKCDSVSYFQEFFAQLNDAEGRRILGVTFPSAKATNDFANVYVEHEGNRLTKLFNRLYQSLADKRLIFMAREESIEKRTRAYEFPRELKKLRGEMVPFLLDVFRPSSLHPPVRFRGFYFSGKRLVPRGKSSAFDETSATLDMSAVHKPLDATIIFSSNNVTREYSSYTRGPVEKTADKWTFLTDLFKNIILSDPAGHSASPVQHIGESKRLNIAFCAAGVFCLLLCLIWAFSWQRNFRLLSHVESAILATHNSPAQSNELLADLQTLLPSMQLLHSYNRVDSPISYHWGLYSGVRAGEQLDRLYFARFRQVILDPVLHAITSQFQQLQSSSPVSEDIYKELKVYRTITSRSCKPDDLLIASMMLPVWTDAVSHDPESQAFADKQIQFYSRELKIADPYHGTILENGEAVSRAQIYLQNLTGPEQILQALLNQARQLPAEKLSAYASNYIEVLSGPDQIDGPYTRTGWGGVEDSIRDHKLMSSGEPCVVGNGTNQSSWGDSKLDVQVQKSYSDSYIQQWKQFLQAHHVIPFANAMDASQKLRILADNNRSPLLALVYMTSTNTKVVVPQSLADRAVSNLQTVAAGAGTTVKNVLNRISGSGKSQPTAPSNTPPPPRLQTVAAIFDPVHAMVDPGSRDKWLNDKNQPYIKALGDLSIAMQMLPSQVHLDVQPEAQQLDAARTALTNADAALHTLAANFPNTPEGIDIDLQNLLREPIDLARRTVAAVPVIKAPLNVAGAAGSPAAPPPDPGAPLKLKATIKQVNNSAVGLCSTGASLQHKFPFEATSTTDTSIEEVNALLQPGTGAYSQFANSPDVSKSYNHSGRVWAAKPEFPATFSQPFLNTLNGFAEAEDELYSAGGDAPHIDITLTVDGTGKIPFELDVDGHTMKFTPGKQTPPLRLVWPPITNTPAKLILKNGGKNSKMPSAEFAGPWALFRLLQSADDQSGNVFTFRNVQFGHSLNPLTNEKGVPGTIQIRIDSAASNLFSRGYFSKLRCNDLWALQPNSSN